MIKNLNGHLVLNGEIPLRKSNETLVDILNLGMRLGVTINTHSRRQIGKTTSLIEFAKKYNFIVVVSTNVQAKLLKKKYNFENIYGQENIHLRKMQICIIDDDVNINKLLKDMECKIITGYYNENINVNNLTSNFNEEIVNFLKDEEKDLRIRTKNCKNHENYAMYKQLISAYSEIIRIIKQYDWQLCYEIRENNGQKQISIWKQNGDELIKDFKIWNITENNNVNLNNSK